MNVGERIHKLITETNTRQTDFSEKTGIANSTVNNWKTRGVKPQLEHLIPTCEFFNVNIYWLLTGEGEKYISDMPSESRKFSDEERKLIENWRKLTERQKGRAEQFIIDMLKGVESANDTADSANDKRGNVKIG